MVRVKRLKLSTSSLASINRLNIYPYFMPCNYCKHCSLSNTARRWSGTQSLSESLSILTFYILIMAYKIIYCFHHPTKT